MCFSAPKVKMPEVVDKPTITETTAPEPQAPVFGGGDSSATETSSNAKKTGISSLKVKPTMAYKTGANRGLKPGM